METPLFLTDSEIVQLTARKVKRCQIDALRQMGIPFRVNAAGRPVVCRSAVEGGRTAYTVEPTSWQPAVLRHGKASN